jgi:glycosyltransferase involved in cell wall biosynthesis
VISRIQQFDVFIFDSPIFADLGSRLKKLQNTLVVYHCPDDYFAYPEIGNPFKLLEKNAVNTADVIITPTQSIRESISSRNKDLGKDIRVIPNGVSAREIASFPSKRDPQAVPRIGFIGKLGSWVDLNLVIAIAARMPECEFIVAGDGANINWWRRISPPNCKFVGRVSMAGRTRLISSFGVGLIPFRRVPLADSAFPLKLLEYFARGVPVVSSSLVEMRNIADGFVYFADSVEAWVNEIKRALNDSYETKKSYIEFASRFTWEHTADSLLEMISEKRYS